MIQSKRKFGGPSIFAAFSSAVSTVQKLSFLADASDWNGTDLSMGDATLSQPTPSLRPAVAGDRLVFDGDYLSTANPDLIDLAESGEVEISLIYRPNALANGFPFSFGDTSTNSDNAIQFYALSNGQIRVFIDGTTGSGSKSFTTSMAPMVVGQDYLITIIMSGGFFTMRVNGIEVISNSAITGSPPIDMDIFTIGARRGSSANTFCNGEIAMIEVREI